MNESTVLLAILGAACATYVPRAVPFVIGFPDRIPRLLARFLKAMPVAALGALIFPAVILSFPDMPAAGIAGVLAAAGIAWLWRGLILPVLVSIVISYLMLSLPG